MADEDDSPREAPSPPAKMGVAEWMVTYGDMMTLLLCFFVLLFIFSSSDAEKYREAVESIQQTFGVQKEDPTAAFMAVSPNAVSAVQKMIDEAQQNLQTMLKEIVSDVVEENPDLKQSMRVDVDESGIKLVVRNSKLFLPGTAYLNKDARKLLLPIIEASKENSFDILVRSNTPKADLNTQYFQSVWELSGARSGAALRALASAGNIPLARLKAVGLGDSSPLFPEHEPANIDANNRTEFLFYFPGKAIW